MKSLHRVAQTLFILLLLLMAVEFGRLILKARTLTVFASSESNRFHKPSCPWALRIKLDSLSGYPDSQHAQAAGLSPCLHCRPAD